MSSDPVIRPFQPADTAAVVRLLQSALVADKIDEGIFARKVLLDQNFDHDLAPVAVVGDRVVGFMLGIRRRYPLEDAAPDFNRSWITLAAVDKEYRRQGIGTKLLGHIETYVKKDNVESIWISPYAPNYFTPGIDVAAYPEAVSFFTHRGYEESYRPLSMEADLTGFVIPEWVLETEKRLQDASIRVVRWETRHILPLLAFMKKEFPGDWQRLIRETMQDIVSGRTSADHIWVAETQDAIVGFSHHSGERFGPFGVSPDKRGLGIGAILLFRCMESMKSKGLRRAWFMWTDDATAKLYAKAGFGETRRYVVLRKFGWHGSS